MAKELVTVIEEAVGNDYINRLRHHLATVRARGSCSLHLLTHLLAYGFYLSE